MGHQVVVHTVITGSQALPDTLNGFAQLVTQYPDECQFVVWLNPYWGPVESEGKTFEQMKVYQANKNRVSSIIHIPALKAETYGRDWAEIQEARITFDEALARDSLTIMMRQRLKLIRQELYAQLENTTVI